MIIFLFFLMGSTFQSTLPARGATLVYPRGYGGKKISIHAPREGSDISFPALVQASLISIHAPREGSDARDARRTPKARDFNPRSPRGERRQTVVNLSELLTISIHAPREGSDR